MNVPRLATGSSFYKRKLTLFNLCFHVTMPDKSTHGFCYPWTEVDGQRGGNEIASCLHHFLTTNPLVMRRNKIIFWSDGCVGQNKNRMVVAALLSAISSRQPAINDEVIYAIKYFETGHSMMEADGMHGLIERAGRGVEMGTPDSYYTLFQTAKVSPPRYTVKVMEFSDFKDFRDLSERAIRDSCLTGISKWHMICFRKNHRNKVAMFVSDNYEADQRSVAWRPVGAQANLSFLRAAYEKPLPVSKAKIRDCLGLVDKLTNHRSARQFFEGLLEDQERLYPTHEQNTPGQEATNAPDRVQEDDI